MMGARAAIVPRRIITWLLIAVTLSGPSSGEAHVGSRAMLSLTEAADGLYEVAWQAESPFPRGTETELRFPDDCRTQAARSVLSIDDAVRRSTWLDCGGSSLAGQTIRIAGMRATAPEVVIRIEALDGRIYAGFVNFDSPSYVVPSVPGRSAVAAAYGRLGIQHILGGVDHLMFVFGLMLLVSGVRRILVTVTSFTVAHSITLAAAITGLFPGPGDTIEIVIALSIVLLAYEALRKQRGMTSITARHPWSIAFGFGLIHGFGFAGGLRSIGLPEAEIPAALLFFNLGIEIGQVGFVAMLFAAAALIRMSGTRRLAHATAGAAWCIGIAGSYLLFDQLRFLLSAGPEPM